MPQYLIDAEHSDIEKMVPFFKENGINFDLKDNLVVFPVEYPEEAEANNRPTKILEFPRIDLNSLSKADLVRLFQHNIHNITGAQSENEVAFILTVGKIQQEFNEKSLQNGLKTRWEDLTATQKVVCMSRAAEILSEFDWNDAVMELIHDLLDGKKEGVGAAE